MQEEFQKTVKRLKTEIEKPDFKPFKQVKEKKVRLKKTRITKKPLEYMGSGVGTSGAHALRNSKKLSIYKSISALNSSVHQEHKESQDKQDKNGN